jgi:hypothetical protein
MKRRAQIVLVGALLVGAAAISSMKRGARCDNGSRDGGACCPLMSGLNLWPTNGWAAVESTNGKAELAASASITNRQR